MLKKKNIVLGIASFLFLMMPVLVVKADPTHSIVFSCNDTTITTQQETTCTIKVNVLDTNVHVVSFGGKVSITESDGTTSSQKLLLGNYSYNHTNWNGTVNAIENNEFTLTRSADSEPLSGLIEIGTFTITAGHSTGTVRVNLNNIMVGNKADANTPTRELTDPSSAYVDITITEGSGENTNTNNGENTNTNNGENTNTNNGENTNNNENTNTNSGENTNNEGTDASKTNTKNPDNPGTGVTISMLGISALVIGAVAYIILRKKNYFNRI